MLSIHFKRLFGFMIVKYFNVSARNCHKTVKTATTGVQI